MASTKNSIPTQEIESLAKVFLPEIVAFFETEEGKKEFEEWKRQRETKKNRVGGCPLIEQPTSHTTVHTVPYTAVQ